MNTIRTGTYKDVSAVILENDDLTVKILPDWGSKIASIVYMPLNRELLWQNPGDVYRKTAYGDGYETGEVSGFDEMFPTITACRSENTAREIADVVEIPDHGEVWSIPWEYETRGDTVRLHVNGVRFPYRLEKQVSLIGAAVHIEYAAENLSGSDFDFIWAAHPLFNASEGMEIIVPEGMNEIINSVPGPRFKEYGKRLSFPIARLAAGSEFRCDAVPAQNDSGYQKYYFAGKVSEGWCRLYDRENGLNIGLSFPVETVPYLGMWVNEGGWEGQYNIAPEPATGAMDSVEASKTWGMNSVLKPGEPYRWYLNIEVAGVSDPGH
jgi:galactose mutarotase-like enzyme